MTRSRKPDRKGDETEPRFCEIPKRILLASWDRDTSRPAVDGVGSWGRGDLMCPCCKRDANSDYRRRLDDGFLFCRRPNGTCF